MSVDMQRVENIARKANIAAAEALAAEQAANEAAAQAREAVWAAELEQVLAVERIDYLVGAPNRPTFFHTNSLVQKDVSYATEAEVLAFANKIRAAGGAEILEALLPSRPTEAKACLIANALNFGCSVDADAGLNEEGPNGEYRWVMHLPVNMPEEQMDTLAETLDIRRHGRKLILPWIIGNAARAFDEHQGWTTKYVE